jgi:hypothetical protein
VTIPRPAAAGIRLARISIIRVAEGAITPSPGWVGQFRLSRLPDFTLR